MGWNSRKRVSPIATKNRDNTIAKRHSQISETKKDADAIGADRPNRKYQIAVTLPYPCRQYQKNSVINAARLCANLVGKTEAGRIGDITRKESGDAALVAIVKAGENASLSSGKIAR